jgi:alkylhydroperoxidase/carboxymuconolactone decarboxylase family protein YurZ
MSADPTAVALDRLRGVKEKRGYLLPHHGLLAITAPALLEGYDACYSALTLTPRLLPERDKEFIWLCILIVREEFLASQHLAKFRRAGGTDAEVETAVRLATLARGAVATHFISEHWQHHMPGYDALRLYGDTLEALMAGSSVPAKLAHLALCAAHTSLRGFAELGWHLRQCYALAVPEAEIAEAMSYAMFTGSIPYFIEGCAVWRDLIRAGEVPASALFKAWAEIDQDGPG